MRAHFAHAVRRGTDEHAVLLARMPRRVALPPAAEAGGPGVPLAALWGIAANPSAPGVAAAKFADADQNADGLLNATESVEGDATSLLGGGAGNPWLCWR